MAENATPERLQQTVVNLKAGLSGCPEAPAERVRPEGAATAENAKTESRVPCGQMINQASEAIFIIQDGRVKFSNPKTWNVTGYSADELSKKPFVEMIHPEDRPLVVERDRQRSSGKIIASTHSFRLVSKAGKEIRIQLNEALTRWQGKPATINFLRDVSQQKKLEKQRLQSRKMEAIGTLAGGIAHDFNNLLMGINGRAALAIMDLDPTHPAYGHLKGIEDLVNNAADLTRQLLGFARGGKYETKLIDVNHLVERTGGIFSRTRKEISLQTRLAGHLWQVEADQSQLEQVLLSLYLNAWQAMPRGAASPSKPRM